MISNATKRLVSALAIGFAFLGISERAEAQEILLTGPLAGAPAVRQLRLYRQSRFEIAPSVSFTLLDEYQRTILFGARLTYNITDWLGIGVWGAYGAIKIPTALSDHIQDTNKDRRAGAPNPPGYDETLSGRLLKVNMSTDFTKQLGGIDLVLAPQLTFTPFRGKIALFQSIYIDTDLYISLGPSFVWLKERALCNVGQCGNEAIFPMESRMAISGTGALGLMLYVNKWSALGFEFRALPFSWNRGGFDTAGGGKDKEFPDNAITASDQRWAWNTMFNISYSFYLPTQYKISE